MPGGCENATREHVAYLQPEAALEPHPIFVDFSDPAVYGLPTPGSDLYKIALHHGGDVIDPDAPTDPPRPRTPSRHWRTTAWRTPALPACKPVAVEIDTCIYDNTPNEDFVLHHAGNVVVGAGMIKEAPASSSARSSANFSRVSSPVPGPPHHSNVSHCTAARGCARLPA